MRWTLVPVVLVGLAGAVAFLMHASHQPLVVYRQDGVIDIRTEEIRWKSRIEAVGGKAAYEELGDAIAHLLPGQQHILAHAFGAALFDAEGERGAGVCDTRYLFGCWHEYLGRFVSTEGMAGIGKVYRICDASVEDTGTSACIHAFGHGLVGYFGYTLPELRKAIHECAVASGTYVGECYNGAFMEYQMRFLSNGDTSDVRPISGGDLYDPCDKFAPEFAPRCVENLPAWWFVRATTSTTSEVSRFKKLGQLCQALPVSLASAKPYCYSGIGLMLSYLSSTDFQQYLDDCAASATTEGERVICLAVAGADTGVQLRDHSAGLGACNSLSGSAKDACEMYARGTPWDTKIPLPNI